MKNIIYCSVQCNSCGNLASNSGWYSPDRIRRLKAETKDWKEDEEYMVICPECQKKKEVTP